MNKENTEIRFKRQDGSFYRLEYKNDMMISAYILHDKDWVPVEPLLGLEWGLPVSDPTRPSKKPIFLISTEGKSLEQIQTETKEAYKRFWGAKEV